MLDQDVKRPTASTRRRHNGANVGHCCENIVKRYGDFEAVKDVSFSVAEGEIFGLLGPNGAGKSTLIRMMTTLIPITAGKAIVAGYDVAKDPDAVRRMIGVIPQALTSDPDLTVEENLSIYAKLYSVPRARAREEYRPRSSKPSTSSSGAARRSRRSPAECAAALKLPAAWSTTRILLSRRTHHRPRSGLPHRRLGDARQSAQPPATSPSSSPPTTWKRPTSSATASPLSITASWSPLALRIELKHSVPGANVVEVHFDRETEEWQARLEKLDGVTERAGRERRLLSRAHLLRLKDHHGAGGDGGLAGRDAYFAQRPEHHARRRLCPLYGPPTAR